MAHHELLIPFLGVAFIAVVVGPALINHGFPVLGSLVAIAAILYALYRWWRG